MDAPVTRRMTVFGADPESNDMGWTQTPTRRVYVSAPVRELTNYFAYHRSMGMSQRCDEDDKSKLNMLFSRRLKQGFTSEAIKQVIDRFYQTPAGQSDYPVPLFCTNDVQNGLMAEADVSKSDPVLQWLLDGMPNEGPFTEPREIRKAVILHCSDSLLRYPDLVANILRIDDPEQVTAQRLSALEDLIYWNLEDFDGDVEEFRNILDIIELPRELSSMNKSPKSIREKKETLKQAIVAIPIKRKKENW